MKKTKYIYFSTISKNVTFSLSKDSLENDFSNYSFLRKQNEFGSNIISFNEIMTEIYLIIKCSINNNDIEYTFKYYSDSSDNIIINDSYENGITLTKNDDKLKLKIPQIPLEKTINYYIRIFEEHNNSLDIFDLSTSFRANFPYYLFKINSNDSILKKDDKYFELNITTDKYKNYYIDGIAEIILNEKKNDKDYLAYKIDKKVANTHVKNDSLFDNRIIIIAIIIVSCVLITIILFLICCVCRYRNKYKDLEDQIKEISFKDDIEYEEETIKNE